MIAIQGQLGSFHHEATEQLRSKLGLNFGDILACNTFRNVFESVKSGQAGYGLVAIENNLHGSINEVYRLLKEFRPNGLQIIADIRIQINQNLIAKIPTNLEYLAKIKDLTVMSHPVALEQVDGWLRVNLPNAVVENYRDTAASIQRVVQSGGLNQLAVAGRGAVATYGGHIVAENIQDDPDNYTRFVLLKKTNKSLSSATHGSMIITTNHTKGALLRALRVFDKHSSNLVKLDSHPIPSDQQHYDFYIDYELPKNLVELKQELSDQGNIVTDLGRYQTF